MNSSLILLFLATSAAAHYYGHGYYGKGHHDGGHYGDGYYGDHGHADGYHKKYDQGKNGEYGNYHYGGYGSHQKGEEYGHGHEDTVIIMMDTTMRDTMEENITVTVITMMDTTIITTNLIMNTMNIIRRDSNCVDKNRLQSICRLNLIFYGLVKSRIHDGKALINDGPLLIRGRGLSPATGAESDI
ncbi:hypothetical protein PFISCL1PPCAC_1351, partial [Pristionchus fissidentatus]